MLTVDSLLITLTLLSYALLFLISLEIIMNGFWLLSRTFYVTEKMIRWVFCHFDNVLLPKTLIIYVIECGEIELIPS